jgi:butyryl-CoA dehydrogenase
VLAYGLRDFASFPMAPLLQRALPQTYAQCVQMQRDARNYCEAHVRGRAERLDQAIRADHELIPHELICASAPYHFTSMNAPSVLGGGNHGPVSTAIFAEEIAAADAGVFVIYGAHALAFSLVLASLDTRMLARLTREMRAADDTGEPLLLALAHTEPGGGSDVEDVEEINGANISSRYRRVPGGFRVSARKVFISNGSIARYNLVTAYADPARAADTLRAFLVPQNAEGFSLGRTEHKLGQRLSCAVEVICDDVFVPDADALDLTGERGRAIDTALSLTRGPVGAMSTGIIRGTLERTLAYLQHKRVGDHFLFEEQHVQLALADMLSALQTGRGLYLNAALAVEQWGLGAVLRRLPRWVPEGVSRSVTLERMLAQVDALRGVRAAYEHIVPKPALQSMVAHSSLAKFTCSDLAVRTAMRALELLGPDANDPRWGVEKQLRDAKLAQIFEGTNQVNRLHTVRGWLHTQ